MKIITDREHTLATLEQCRRAGVALFAPNAESPSEIEGICLGAQEYAEAHGLRDVPVAVGMTSMYADNPQFRKISTGCRISEDASALDGGNVRQGCEIWLRHLAVYADLGESFPAVRLLPFIDHGWAPDPLDYQLMTDPTVVERMAIIMFDASKYDFDRNVELTRQYVRRFGRQVVVEGAADKIYEPKDILELKLSRQDQLSHPDKVEQYVDQTGVDLIVPNLGTEHRSVGVGENRREYERELARTIRDRVGAIMSLHGSSCLGGQVGTTAADGIAKVNFYTAMAVGGGNRIYRVLKQHEDLVERRQNLWINSPSFFDDLRRRHVAAVCAEMLQTLHYDRLT